MSEYIGDFATILHTGTKITFRGEGRNYIGSPAVFYAVNFGFSDPSIDRLIERVIAAYGPSVDDEDDEDDPIDYHDDDYFDDFADPGGNSALRASSPSNPRNLPCPTCGRQNVLTPKDVALGYQCDTCADRAEMGY